MIDNISTSMSVGLNNISYWILILVMCKKAVHKSMYKSKMDRNAEFKTHKQAQKGNYTTKEKNKKYASEIHLVRGYIKK